MSTAKITRGMVAKVKLAMGRARPAEGVDPFGTLKENLAAAGLVIRPPKHRRQPMLPGLKRKASR